MNPLRAILGNLGSQQLNGNNLMLQAFGAMMRGESPQTFIQNLAKSNPELAGLDLTNLEGSARQLCKDRNIDVDQKMKEVDQKINELKLNVTK